MIGNDSRYEVGNLIRSMGVSTPCRHMLLLGAGASITSGIPSAARCIWQWKLEIFLSANPQSQAALYSDVTLPSVQDRVQRWIDAQGKYPRRGDREEYAFYAEACYPDAQDRRRYFEKLVEDSHPALGYRLLGILIEAGHFSWIWTTNFDDLVADGRPEERKRVIRSAGMDSAQRVSRFDPDDRALRHVWLHGDYRYDKLRNTSSELQTLDEQLRSEFGMRCREYPLVVIGYSGSDDSVMSTLEAAVSKPGHARLFWLQLREKELTPRVKSLLQSARTHGHQAVHIEYDGFDQFMFNLATYILRNTTWSESVETLIGKHRPPQRPFSLSGWRGTQGYAKSNSWPVQAPEFLYQFSAGDLDWKSLRAKLDSMGGRISAGLLRGHVLALGAQHEIAHCFEVRPADIQQVPISPDDLRRDEGVVLSVLRDALARALVQPGLQAERTGRCWSIFDPRRAGTASGLHFHKSVEIRLENRGGELYLTLTPDRFFPVELPDDNTKERIAVAKAKLLGRQWNRPFNHELNHWRNRLALDNTKAPRTVVFPPNEEVGFRFSILPGPVLTQEFDNTNQTASSPPGRRTLYRFKFFRCTEPKLRFRDGSDIHPIRGLLQLRPYETENQLQSMGVRVGVVVPSCLGSSLRSFLAALLQPHPAIETKREYLVEYPGFERAFQLGLAIPPERDNLWVEIPSQPTTHERQNAFREILESIVRAIERISASATVDAIIVGVPASWARFETIQDDAIDLDLHDQVKAHCATKGIRTQFIREQTFDKQQRNEVLWWLALALFAKSRRTPWLLDRVDESVAFVGLGHAIDRRRSDFPIVLGCSHVFQASGLGLRFHLSRIQNPIWRGKNPYLSRDDALRVGYQTRQLFLESVHRLPARVVLCKRTHFLPDELEGLRAGLDGVGSLDFLTIEQEWAWRYVVPGSDNEAAPYPIRRGTCVLLDKETFFLWVHGAVRGLDNSNRTYFKGGTRIPAPMRVRRFAGDSCIEELTADLMALSKMDWNSFDLYGQWPAPLTSSQRIARIGRLLERYHQEILDYRLFM